MALAFVFVLALLLAIGAIWLFVRAGKREREEEILLRLRAMGGDEAAYVMPVDSQLHNPLLRWACYLVWRTGTDMTGDGSVDINDFNEFTAGFSIGDPGPSALVP